MNTQEERVSEIIISQKKLVHVDSGLAEIVASVKFWE